MDKDETFSIFNSPLKWASDQLKFFLNNELFNRNHLQPLKSIPETKLENQQKTINVQDVNVDDHLIFCVCQLNYQTLAWMICYFIIRMASLKKSTTIVDVNAMSFRNRNNQGSSSGSRRFNTNPPSSDNPSCHKCGHHINDCFSRQKATNSCHSNSNSQSISHSTHVLLVAWYFRVVLVCQTGVTEGSYVITIT